MQSLASFSRVSRPRQTILASAGTFQNANLTLQPSTRTQHGLRHIDKSTNIKWHEGGVSLESKESLLGQRGCVLWFTGLSGSGKSTVACTLEHALREKGYTTALLDGDNIRHGLNKNLGFTPEDRSENIRRIGEVSKLFADNGIITLVSFISPYRRDRLAVRQRLEKHRFIEVFMNIPIDVCETRDPKGLYKLAREGKIKSFTGISDPYEAPENAEIVLQVKEGGVMVAPEAMAGKLIQYLDQEGYLLGGADASRPLPSS